MTKYHYSLRNNRGIYSIQLTPKVILGILKIIILILIVIFAKQIYFAIYNLLVYRHQRFTEDITLIELACQIRSDFKNSYGFSYRRSDLILELENTQAQLEAKEYQELIERGLPIEKIFQLFNRYLKDWNDKNFDAIAEYTLRPFSLAQKEIYYPNCGNNFDLVCNWKIKEIKPIKFERKEELKRFIMQINGKIVNFKLDSQGYVVSGEATPRFFTEYWDVALDDNNKAYIVSIYQIKKSDRITNS